MILECKNLSLSYGDKIVLDNFSLTLPLEGITALKGPSGCGKTSLLRLIAGLEGAERGTITGIRPEETSFLFQENRLLPWRSVEQHLTDVMSRPAPKRAKELLALVELNGEEKRLPAQLSGGMGRRLALGRALALESRLLLRDEPLAGVDPERAERILTRLKAMGTPILLVSHEERITALADRVVELDTRELREVLEDVPLNSYDVMQWIEGNLQEQYGELSEDDGHDGEE